MAEDLLTLTLRFHVHGGSGPCVVRSVRGVERVSEPFRYEVEFLSSEVDLDAARAAEAALEITDAAGHERFIHGVIEELSVAPTLWEVKHLYRAVVVPEPTLLRYRHGFRTFQNLDVVEICTQVLTDAGISGERFEWRVSERYESREVCIQYDESEWDFLSRLLEEEGIWYRFEHRADGHTMVFADDNAAAPLLEPSPLSFDFAHADALGRRAYAVADGARMVEGRVTLDDFDGFHPSRHLTSNASASGPDEREWYEYPGRHATEAAGHRRARSLLDELRRDRRVFELETTAFSANAGYRLIVAGAPLPVPDGFLVESRLTLAPREEDAADEGGESDSWSVRNSLRVIPEEQQFRPPRRTPRPVIAGPQTARVSGPGSQEVHLDDRGRVKVQFHWDRGAQLDEHASCWIPVSQGQTTGAIMHPRVGWEVVVEFREGDPDRPVVTGRVYNPFFPPPHALPERKTDTAHRSDSLPGRERIHEIRFEDQAGNEHISVTAGYDLREVTVVDRRVAVGNDDNREVGVDRSEIVGVLRQLTSVSNRSDSVAGSQDTVVGQDRISVVRHSASEQVSQDLSYATGGLVFAQVGEEVPGQLQTMLKESDEEPASVLMESIEPLLTRAQAAAADGAADGGSAQSLLEGNAQPVDVLGSVVGQLAAGSAAPPEEARGLETLGSSGEVADTEGLGAATQASHRASSTADHTASDGVASGLVDAAGDAGSIPSDPSMVERPDGLTEDQLEGPEIVGGQPSHGTQDEEQPGQLLPRASTSESAQRVLPSILGELATTSDEVTRSDQRVTDVSRSAGEATPLARQASGLKDGGEALGVLSALSQSATTLEPESLEPSMGQGPLGFLDRVRGVVPATSGLWSSVTSIAGDLDGIVTRMAELFSPANADRAESAEAPGPALDPQEHTPADFAAAVGEAVLRGALEAPDSAEGEEGDEGAGEDAGEGASGAGTWTSTVGGAARENVAGASVVGAGGAARFGVGGSSREVAGLARLEQVGGSRVEQIDGSKTETTGRYAVVASEGVSFDVADTMSVAARGDCTVTIAGSYTTTSGGDLTVAAANLDLAGGETITFECGAARLSISGDGIAIEGTQIVVRGDTIGVDSPSMG